MQLLFSHSCANCAWWKECLFLTCYLDLGACVRSLSVFPRLSTHRMCPCAGVLCAMCNVLHVWSCMLVCCRVRSPSRGFPLRRGRGGPHQKCVPIAACVPVFMFLFVLICANILRVGECNTDFVFHFVHIFRESQSSPSAHFPSSGGFAAPPPLHLTNCLLPLVDKCAMQEPVNVVYTCLVGKEHGVTSQRPKSFFSTIPHVTL